MARRTVEMRVSLLDVPPIMAFIKAIASLAVESDELEVSDIRVRLGDALDVLSMHLNPVDDDPYED